MSGLKQVGTLQIDQDLPYQQKFWVIQLAGWIVFLMLLLAAALGLAGGAGPLNQSSVDNGQIEVKYQPFARRVAPTDIDVTLKSLAGSTAQLMVQRDFLNEYQIQKITPEPSSVKAGDDMLIYEFSVPEGATSLGVSFALEPDAKTIGSTSGGIGQTREALILIRQFVYP